MADTAGELHVLDLMRGELGLGGESSLADVALQGGIWCKKKRHTFNPFRTLKVPTVPT